MKPSELVKRAKDRQGATSAYRLAQITGVSEDSIRNYEKDKVGKQGISNEVARRLAEAAGMNALEVIAELEMEKATDEATKSAWGKALASMRGSASALLLAVLAGLTACIALALGQPFGLAEVYQWVMNSALSIMFIMSTLICAWVSLQSSDS